MCNLKYLHKAEVFSLNNETKGCFCRKMEVKDYKENIILDTDIGDDIDDAYALNYLLARPEVNFLGISTVYRNCKQRAKIVKTFVDLHNRDIPVYAGEDFPFAEPLKPFENAPLDERGIWGIPHYDPATMADKQLSNGSAVEFIAQTLLKYPKQITVVAIGPLTNIAKVCKCYPGALSNAKQLLLMGGNFTEPSAEWNILCDPEAADIVFRSGADIKAIGVDITRKCTLSAENLDFLRNLPQTKMRLLVKMTDIWINHNRAMGNPPTMHDPLAVAELLNKYCSYACKKVSVCLQGELRGCTVDDENGGEIKYATACDYSAFISHLLSTLKA